jgi:hypothetical protein
MIRIKNQLGQPLVVNCGKGRVAHLLPAGMAVLSEEEFAVSEVQGLLQQGAISQEEVGKRPAEPEPKKGSDRRKER